MDDTGILLEIPSGNDCYISIENGPFLSLVFPLNIVIFHSYVKLPEGMGYTSVIKDGGQWEIPCKWRFQKVSFPINGRITMEKSIGMSWYVYFMVL